MASHDDGGTILRQEQDEVLIEGERVVETTNCDNVAAIASVPMTSPVLTRNNLEAFNLEIANNNNNNDVLGLLLPATRPLPSPPSEAIAAAAAAVLGGPQPSPATGSETRSMKKMSPGETSARQQQKKKTGPRISLRCRVKVTRKHLWPILKYDGQREVLVKGYPDNYNFHGQVISGNNSSGYVVRFDLLPAPFKDVNVGRKRLGVVATEEERPFDR